MYLRLLGSMLIIKWVAPFFLIVAALFMAYEVFIDVEQVSRGPLQRIEASAERRHHQQH